MTSDRPQDVEDDLGERSPSHDDDEDTRTCPTCGQHVVKEGAVVHRLLVITGKSTGIYWPIAQGKALTIGRGSSADIQLRDGLVSRSHAEIKGQAETCLLSDLGSANGTYVNGNAVKTKELDEGDVITIGDTRIIFGKGETG